MPFFTRPISAVLWITIVLVILLKIPAVGRVLVAALTGAAPRGLTARTADRSRSRATWKPFVSASS